MIRLNIKKSMSPQTKGCIKNFNKMNEQEFMNKYSVSKKRYAKRVIKHGDPYNKSLLSKFGIWLSKRNK